MKKILTILITFILIALGLSTCNTQSVKKTDKEIEQIDSIKIKSKTDEGKSTYTEYCLGDAIVYDTTIAINRKETPYKGQIKKQNEWWDLGGLNRFILSSVYNYNEGFGRAEIFAYQYVKNNDKWTLVWQMNDFIDGMGCDLQIKILELEINDIDKNGEAEVVMMYTRDNRCDAVFITTKLLLYENAQKIAIRGVSSQYLMPPEDVFNKVMDIPEGEYVKYKNIDPGVFYEDTIFVQYASDFWDDFINNENEQYKKRREEFQKKKKEEAERKKLKRAKKNR